ncbi:MULTISPECIES: LptE family protein [Aestuariibaculum]|uniref:LptE family protein n=1 Tax=Aestuariibaculum marinum TaxID=2683592 RepID=A0A8J6U5A8_9FLAO|nr:MULTISPECIES: LptE family protein [Aestuariibaculum]MBD0824712.1 LptE family protein [Aestuariibaculum marinum]WMI64067.1 LptE family protein [Aestuariibaculum sp. YM273]
MKKHLIYLSFFALSITLFNCGIYSFTGASVPANVKTFQVNRFENTALLFEPGLDLQFQNALQDLIQNQTNLSLVTTNGDLLYEGEITDYRVSPTTATSDNRAAQNRLTISVKVRFFNKKKEEDDLEQSFSFFYDYDGSAMLTGSQKTTAHEEIFERLTQDIFNATLAKW